MNTENEKEVRVSRHSWWKSSDGKREFVVVNLEYSGGTTSSAPTDVEILEKRKPLTYRVKYRDWINSIKSGALERII